MRLFFVVAPLLLGACGAKGPAAIDGSPDAMQGVGPTGGTVDTLRFAIVGDTRPVNIDDVPGYPTAVITRIWQDVENENPRPDFAVSTGDYMFAGVFSATAGPMMDLYLSAVSQFTNLDFPAMGNHECTGATNSNCGPGNANGETLNYNTFMSKMMAPLGNTTPYYEFHVNAKDGSWTAKFIVIAANAWDQTQSDWLTTALAESTTYTFVVRHEESSATDGPGVTPSKTIIDANPHTMLICGHDHTLNYFKSGKEIVVGNGGAPLTSTVNYGYVVVERRADGAIQFTAYDYMSHAVMKQFAVDANGNSVP
jgi:hypothetical protein